MALNVTTETFDQEVIQSEKPVLVDFWAEWCGPCHAVAPVLDRIAAERETKLKLVKVNIDTEHELQQRYGVASIPTMILFKDGEPSASVIGAQPKGAIERSLGLAFSPPDDSASPATGLFMPARRRGRGYRTRVSPRHVPA